MSESLRKATETDASSISELVRNVAEEFIGPTLNDQGLETLLSSMDVDATRQRILDDWPHWCLWRGELLIAIVVVRPPAHLYHLFVRSSEQRSGIASRLLATADEEAQSRTGKVLQTVNASLNAIAFYKQAGFHIASPPVDHKGVRYQPMERDDAGSKEG